MTSEKTLSKETVHLISFDETGFLFLRKVCNDSEENASSSGMEIDDSEDDSSPLFFQPGKIGFYSPRQGKGSDERLNCFRNVGRSCIGGILHSSLIKRFYI